MKKIAIVAHFAYGAMSGGHSGHVGGVERQTSLMAKGLAKRGFQVTLITWDEGQPDNQEIDGVRIVKMCRKDEGLPGLRFFYPRWTTLIGALKQANADIYYQNCAEYITGQVAWWCKRNSRRFVYSVASDPDCDSSLPAMKRLRERVLYRYGLMNADSVIVQTRKQEHMLKEGFGRKSIVLPMSCPGPTVDEYAPPTDIAEGEFRVLWIGRIAPVKRVELLIEIAKREPDVQFDIAGGADVDRAYSDKQLSIARTFPNITVHGMVERNRVNELYRNASILCCTSEYEGFPNTFLEAWSYGLPVVSTVDPDGLISGSSLGLIGSDVEELVTEIRGLTGNPRRWKEMSERSRQHYLENYEEGKVLDRYIEMFNEVGVRGS